MDLSSKAKVTPSKHNPFFGAVLPDSGLTRAQERKAEAMRAKLRRNQASYGLPEFYTVRLPKPVRPGHAHEPVDFDYWKCPVISASKDRTRICVIAPDGTDAWINWEKTR